MENKKKTTLPTTIAASFVVLLILIFGVSFVSQAQRGLYEEKLNYLHEISSKSAENVLNQIEGYFSTLAAVSTFIGGHESFDLEHSLPILAKEADKNLFKRMGIISPDGNAQTTDGQSFYCGDRDYFKQAMLGENAVSDCLIDKTDGNEINVMATPIYHNDSIVGVTFATMSQDLFSQNITIESFNGEGYAYVINSSGSPVIKTSHPSSIGDYTNFFEEMTLHGISQQDRERLETDIQNGRDSSFTYLRESIERQLCYAKVGVSDWYIITSVPSHAISVQSDRLIANIMIFTIVLFLVTALISFLVINRFRKNNENLEKLAYTDAVTGYSNRTKFSLDAKKILTSNLHQKFAMIIFDINKFKVINDMFGHDNGNVVLCYVAETVKKNLGELETFSRSSSDNFNILMKYESDEKIISRLEEISSEIAGCIGNYKVELSIGIYPIEDHDLDINVLSDRANISKNIAKKQNDIRYHFFKDENRVKIIKEKELENLMQPALDHHEFLVYLQPKYELKTEKIIGAEALVRWNRSGVGMVFPNDFIPLFEKNGFIRNLDLYMFEQVCLLLKSWKERANGAAVIPISVNISRANLSNEKLAQELLTIAQKHQILPSQIELELTESSVFTDVDNMIQIMQGIKDAGFLLSIDDFGSGYSSLSAIKDLPADTVKIDKSFLDKAINNLRGEKIIHSIISMIKDLELATVAEGAETEQQIELLKRADCDIVQGYYYSKPVPITEFEKLFLENR